MRRRFINMSKIAFDYNNYMTIEALEDNVEIIVPRLVEYGIDGIGWKPIQGTIYASSGQRISIKYSLGKMEMFGNIKISGKCNLCGNCMSLVFGDDAINQNDLSRYIKCFYELFKGCSGICAVQTGFLPATTLAAYCYNRMFFRCTGLTQAPELPATKLANYCYGSMFSNCTSLTQAPELPATELAEFCYGYMFSNCTSLTQAPELPATKLAVSCYGYMFSDCTSLTQAPELPATKLAYNCYDDMFSNCTSLTQAPELPATKLANYCYNRMFFRCTGLTQAPELPATKLANYCYYYMFYGCTSLTQAPELPATKLANYCYYYMFQGCINLSYIKMLATDISATYCLDYWVGGVSSTGTFVKNKDATWDVRGVSGIPSNWKIEYDHNYDIGSDISFHIERIDETLYAKDWMTWDDWVHSKYNTVSASISGHNIWIHSYSSYPLDINLDNIIKNGGTYYFRHFGGSD